MNFYNVSHLLFRHAFEWLSFLIVIIILFNMFTEFAQKTGVTGQSLTLVEVQYYGFISVLLAINNLISNRFFGLRFSNY